MNDEKRTPPLENATTFMDGTEKLFKLPAKTFTCADLVVFSEWLQMLEQSFIKKIQSNPSNHPPLDSPSESDRPDSDRPS